MSRQEFLQRLRDTLTGEVPSGVIEENIRYYDDYIRSEASKGQTEDEVTGTIGDPRLIAKTIIDATENAAETGSKRSTFEGWQSGGQTVYEEETDKKQKTHYIDLSKWYWKLLAVAVVILFFVVVSSIVTGLFSLLMPVLGPILLIWFVVSLFRGNRR